MVDWYLNARASIHTEDEVLALAEQGFDLQKYLIENFPEKEEEITQRATPFDASKIAEDRSRSPSTKSADSISEAVFKPPVNSTPGKYSQPPLTSTTSKVLSEDSKILYIMG